MSQEIDQNYKKDNDIDNDDDDDDDDDDKASLCGYWSCDLVLVTWLLTWSHAFLKPALLWNQFSY